jgi:hypothetical protein
LGVFSHHRSRVFNKTQHPLAHNIDDFAYSNPAFGGSVTNLQQALDWIIAVLYPTQKPAVADVASLPVAGNSIGDMRVVNDDGDGRSASYRWEQREGDAVPKWYKIYDVDFSTDSILSAWTDVTQDVYVNKYGRDDTDSNGLPIAGLLAGQSVYGGKSANTNLNLYANSGDGIGANTGYIQAGDNVRPLIHDTFTLGTTTHRWADIFSVQASIADFTILGDQLDSTTGQFDFIDNNLVTTGNLTANKLTALGASSALASGTAIGNVTISDGSVVSGSGSLSFGANNIATTGISQLGLINISGNTIDSDNTVIDFNFNDLVDVGDVTAQNGFFDTLSIGGTLVDLIIDTNGNITKADNLSITSTGIFTLTGTTVALTGNVTASNTIVAQGKISAPQLEAVAGGHSILFGGAANTILATGGALDLNSSAGLLVTAPAIVPTGTTDLGSVTNPFIDLYLSGFLRLASGNSLSQTTLNTLRNAHTRKLSVAPSNGDTLFWDAATQSWYADHPDSEILHAELNGLSSDDHTQYVMKDGRATGQVVTGGTGAGESLVLASTGNATKGLVLWRDVLAPETDGTDLATLTKQIGDSYWKGQAKGFRVETCTTVTRPSASAAKAGRLILDTTPNALFVDIGGSWTRVGIDTHSMLIGLAADDHTQYTMLAGRAGGQVQIGGTAASENLVLQSTANATRGNVLYRDVLAPESDGIDLGTSLRQVGDLYIKGQGIGFRAENTFTASLPASSATKIGRIVFDQTAKALLVDDGTTWRRAGAEKYYQVDATGWTGSILTLTYTVSSSMQDATKAIWDFCLTSTGEKLYPVITKTTTQVTVTFKMPPPAASYTLIGVA